MKEKAYITFNLSNGLNIPWLIMTPSKKPGHIVLHLVVSLSIDNILF